MSFEHAQPTKDLIEDSETGQLRPALPEEGGAQSGAQIDESRINEPGNDHSPTTLNDVT